MGCFGRNVQTSTPDQSLGTLFTRDFKEAEGAAPRWNGKTFTVSRASLGDTRRRAVGQCPKLEGLCLQKLRAEHTGYRASLRDHRFDHLYLIRSHSDKFIITCVPLSSSLQNTFSKVRFCC
jgi:hypothetical protein